LTTPGRSTVGCLPADLKTQIAKRGIWQGHSSNHGTVLPMNDGLCLQRSQAFYWDTRGSAANLAWVKMVATPYQGSWWQKNLM
jgi:hypothetical protein